MSFWKQIPTVTKVYLAVLVYLILLLIGLVIVRMTNGSIQDSSLWKFFAQRQSNRQTSLTPPVSIFAPSATFPPGTAILQATGNTQVLEGPGDQYAVLALLENNQVAQIIGVSPDKKWWAIDLPYFANKRGWVSVNKVKAENAANVQVVTQGTATPVELVTPGNGATVMALSLIHI